MRKLFCLISFFTAPLALADSKVETFQTQAPWVLVSEAREVARTAKDFIGLQEKYPEYFAEYDPQYVFDAYIIFKNWTYAGETVCEPNDPRLNAQTIAYGLCQMDGHNNREPSICFANENALSPFDPCGPVSEQ